MMTFDGSCSSAELLCMLVSLFVFNPGILKPRPSAAGQGGGSKDTQASKIDRCEDRLEIGELGAGVF